MYILDKVTILGKEYEVSHEFTHDDIKELLDMSTVGIGVSFQKAYQMRFMENHNGISLKNTVLIRKNLAQYLKERGMYIDFAKEIVCI